MLGLVLSVLLTLLLSFAVPALKPGVELDLTAASVAKVAAIALVIAAAAAVLPVWQMARLDPSAAFRRKVV